MDHFRGRVEALEVRIALSELGQDRLPMGLDAPGADVGTFEVRVAPIEVFGGAPDADPGAASGLRSGGFQLFSAGFTATLLDPAPMSVVTGGPSVLLLGFDRPVAPESLGADVVLGFYDPFGNFTSGPPLGPGMLDPSGMLMAVPLDMPLSPGLYTVQIDGGSGLTGEDGTPLLGDGQPIDLGWFVVTDAPPTDPSGPAFAVGLFDPSPESVLSGAPAALVLAFERPLAPDSLGSDVVLLRFDAAGEVEWWEYFGPGSLDETGTLLTVPLSGPLPPGRYGVWIDGSSSIADVDGTFLINDGMPIDLGGFDIVIPTGVTLDDAIDLETPFGEPRAFEGMLDFQADPFAVRLYRIELPPGAFWRLGLEVTAQRDGGPLDAALALFDASGRPIATAELGRRDAPSDPFLFAGLDPGTYYIGVSGAGNLPGHGGYDPATGAVGSILQTQAGGAFRLHVVADLVDGPVRVIDLHTDHADPFSARATGFTIQFSGALRVEGAIEGWPQSLSQAIEVVDRDGRRWPAQVVAYDEFAATLTYVFRQVPERGTYTVRLAPGGGLVDLAGLSPVADGQPAGTLGTITVAIDTGPRLRTDLGALLPDAALAGVSGCVRVRPRNPVAYRFVVTVPGMYTIPIQARSPRLSAQLLMAGLNPITLDTSGGTNDVFLTPGEYQLRLEVAPGRPVHARWTIQLRDLPQDLLTANGVGQGPAMSLRMVAHAGKTPPPPGEPPLPTPDAPGTSPRAPDPAPPSDGGNDYHAPSPSPVPAGRDTAPAPTASTPQPSQVLATPGPSLAFGDLVGRPASEPPGDSDLVAVDTRSALPPRANGQDGPDATFSPLWVPSGQPAPGSDHGTGTERAPGDGAPSPDAPPELSEGVAPEARVAGWSDGLLGFALEWLRRTVLGGPGAASDPAAIDVAGAPGDEIEPGAAPAAEDRPAGTWGAIPVRPQYLAGLAATLVVVFRGPLRRMLPRRKRKGPRTATARG
jgi:hypothetical protein